MAPPHDISSSVRSLNKAVTEPSRFRPSPELVEILAPALEPCRHFAGACAGIARWDPVHGHVPRGFTGAFGTLDEIELVLVVSEPGDPFDDEHYDPESSPIEHIETTAEKSFHHLSLRERHTGRFNTNFCRILDACWPDLSRYEQLRRTWRAESYLCSAPRQGGDVPKASWSVCGRDYLAPQLPLLVDRAMVACGGKAQRRLGRSGSLDSFPCHTWRRDLMSARTTRRFRRTSPSAMQSAGITRRSTHPVRTAGEKGQPCGPTPLLLWSGAKRNSPSIDRERQPRPPWAASTKAAAGRNDRSNPPK